VILKWALEGTLVAQYPEDEPARVLLERIRAERAKSFDCGRRGKLLPDEVPVNTKGKEQEGRLLQCSFQFHDL
jgi:hypothetical protein